MLDRRLVGLVEEMVLQDDRYCWTVSCGRSYVHFEPVTGGYICNAAYYRDVSSEHRHDTQVLVMNNMEPWKRGSLTLHPNTLEMLDTEYLRTLLAGLPYQDDNVHPELHEANNG